MNGRAPRDATLADRQTTRHGRRDCLDGVHDALRAPRLPAGPRKGLQDADANDLCQEVFRVVSQAIAGWDPDPTRGSFRGWLSRITRNLLINFLTRRPHELRGSGATSVQDLLEEQPAPDPSAASFYEAEYRKRLFQWAAEDIKNEFTTTTWAAFWRTAVDGHTPKDVAESLGLSVGAVYIARTRVLARLRKRIEDLGEDN